MDTLQIIFLSLILIESFNPVILLTWYSILKFAVIRYKQDVLILTTEFGVTQYYVFAISGDLNLIGTAYVLGK